MFNKNFKYNLGIALLGVFSMALLVNAEPVRKTISYQSKLLDNGNPVTGNRDLTFHIYSVETGGTPLWTETHTAVEVSDGLFDVILGSVTPVTNPLDLPFDEQYWLEVEVDGTILSPRTEFTNSAYALHANNADSLGGISAASYLTVNNDQKGVVSIEGVSNEGDNIDLIAGSNVTITPDNTAKTITIAASGSSGNISGSGTANCIAKFTDNQIIDDSNIYSGSGGDISIGTSSIGNAKLYIYDDVDNDPGIYVKKDSDGGSAGYFHINNPQNSSNALVVDTEGIGRAAEIGISNFNNDELTALYVYNYSDNYAGYFDGDVHVTGNISEGARSFKIDHPLDPQNKNLNHSSVESPNMMNIYNGNVTLDDNGEAWIELPNWFEALNKDFRYQLTCIGGFAEVYVAEEISSNQFKIAGGEPNMKISWQVTGIRHDPYAKKNRIPVEENKNIENQGYYLHPEAYGYSRERGIDFIRYLDRKDEK